jgi:hypothetical protein
MATVADLIDIALEKFHLLQQPGQEPTPRYRMLIVVNSQGPGKQKRTYTILVFHMHRKLTFPSSSSLRETSESQQQTGGGLTR